MTALTAVMLISGCARDELPEPEAAQASELILPPGFSAQVVFEGTGESRELFIRSDGDLFVSLSGLRDDFHILGLRDENGDHVIDTVEPFYRVTTPEEQKYRVYTSNTTMSTCTPSTTSRSFGRCFRRVG